MDDIASHIGVKADDCLRKLYVDFCNDKSVLKIP